MRTSDKKYKWGDCPGPFPPDEVCDQCHRLMSEVASPIVDQDRCGFYKVFCSRECSKAWWSERDAAHRVEVERFRRLMKVVRC